MVLCLLALPVFAVLSIFSVKYRKLTKDALECIIKTATLRKCESGLDDRIKAQLTGRMLQFSPSAAKFTYNNYKAISWVILIIFMLSLYGSAVGLYNYYQYGNCNGPESTGFCVFDPTGDNSKIADVDTITTAEVVLPRLEDDDPIIGPKDAELTIIEFGCYACPYTKKAEPVVKEVIDYYKGRVNFQFKTFKIPQHNMSYEAALAAECAKEQDAYYEYHKSLFALQEKLSRGLFSSIAEKLKLDTEQFNECFTSEKYKKEIDSDTLMGVHAGVPGTPTFFIKDKKIVGPKPFKTFKNIIDKELGLG